MWMLLGLALGLQDAPGRQPEEWFGRKPAEIRVEIAGRPLAPHEGAVAAVAFPGEGGLLVTAGADRRLRFWNLAETPGLAEERPHEGPLSAVACSADGARVAFAGGEVPGTSFAVRVEALRAGQAAKSLRLEGHTAPVLSLSFSPDGDLLASAGADRGIRLWPLSGRTPSRTLTGHDKAVTAVHFLAEGTLLVSGGADGTLRFWDAPSGSPRLKLETGGRAVSALALRPDGRLLASAGADRLVRLWDVASGLEILRMAGHESLVAALAFSPDGGTLASGSYDGTLRLWDLSGRDTRVLRAGGWVASLAFSPDGRQLAAGRTDGALLLLACPPPEADAAGPAQADLEALWRSLGDRDPLKATRAVRECRAVLRGGGPEIRDALLALLRERLAPLPKDRMDRLIKELDDEEFEVRDRATRELERYGAAAGAALRGLLDGNPSAELRTRASGLLKKIETSGLESPEALRPLRALEVLETARLPATTAILESLADGVESARETQEARFALRRLKKEKR